MNIYRFILIASCVTIMAMPAHSGTLVETTDQDGETVITRFDDGKVRSETAQPGSFVLIDLKKEKAYVVDDSRHIVMDISSQMWDQGQEMAEPAVDYPKARLVEQGKGPTIAGYSTVHYKVMVGDKFCGDEYLSSKAIKEASMQEFSEVMSRMSKQQQQMFGDMGDMMQDPCDAADLTLYESYLEHGMPMRSVDKDGTVNNEVKRIETNVKIPADYFKLPKDYQVTSMEQMMQQHNMSQQNQMENMPDMSGMSKEDMQMMREQLKQQIEEMQRKMENRNMGN